MQGPAVRRPLPTRTPQAPTRTATPAAEPAGTAAPTAAPADQTEPASSRDYPANELNIEGDARIIFDTAPIKAAIKLAKKCASIHKLFKGEPLIIMLVPTRHGVAARIAHRTHGTPYAQIDIPAVDKLTPGVIAFHYKDFINLPTSDATITIRREGTTITSADSSTSVSAESPKLEDVRINVEKWRHRKLEDYTHKTFVRYGTFPLNIIAAANLATCEAESAYAKPGILIRQKESSTALVSTDGRRMTLLEIPAAPVTEPHRVTVPSTAIEIALACGTRELAVDSINVESKSPEHLDTNYIRIKSGYLTVYTAPIEGNFPPYEDVIPADTRATAAFSVKETEAVATEAAKHTDEESRGMALVFTAKEGATATARTKKGGDTWSKSFTLADSFRVMPATDSIKDDFTIGINPGFFADAMTQARFLGSPRVDCRFIASNKPIVFHFATAELKFTNVMMPVNLAAGLT